MYTLDKIAEIVDGKVEGDSSLCISAIQSLESAGEGAITFYAGGSKKESLSRTNASAVLLTESHADEFKGNKIVVSDSYLAYAQVSRLFRKQQWSPDPGIHVSAVVHPDADVGDHVTIGANSTISRGAHIGEGVVIESNVSIGVEARIGRDTIVESNSVIASGCELGERCWISSGAVIGANGFGYVPHDGKWEKIEQIGHVVIGDDVDVGANTTIDRGALDVTLIGDGVKLDNQIQIAHNVHVGDHTIMAGCSAVAGSTKIGKRCKFGGRVSILGHLQIIDDVTVLANGFVSSSIDTAGVYASAIPVQPVKKWRKNLAVVRQLDTLIYRMRALLRTNQNQVSDNNQE